MTINSILIIEDSTEKYMDIYSFLKQQGFTTVDWVTNAEKALQQIENAENPMKAYDLLLCDMHFDYFGKDDRAAGEKLMKLLREKGIEIPIIFCSSQNWKIEGALGNIFYNPRRSWEFEAEKLFNEIKQI